MNISEKIKEKYLSQDPTNPSFIFHGTRELYRELNPHEAHDVDKNIENIQNAVYGSSSMYGAIPYAIKEKGKYDCIIGNEIDDLTMKITYGIIPDDAYGYIYVCDKKSFKHTGGGCQYVSYQTVVPLEIIKVQYQDFKKCFVYINESKRKRK